MQAEPPRGIFRWTFSHTWQPPEFHRLTVQRQGIEGHNRSLHFREVELTAVGGPADQGGVPGGFVGIGGALVALPAGRQDVDATRTAQAGGSSLTTGDPAAIGRIGRRFGSLDWIRPHVSCGDFPLPKDRRWASHRDWGNGMNEDERLLSGDQS